MCSTEVLAAISANDWHALRTLSLEDGGFGAARTRAWPHLLHVDIGHRDTPLPLESQEPHPDERQIGLDTDRSFVLYPVDEERKNELKQDLNQLITNLMRKRRKLQYFQGYHDIISVLFLTLPPDIALPAAEKLSLHRVRDAMGSGLEPLVGQLRVLKHLLRLADPELAAMIESVSPLPYFALSNLLTLFSHDVPTLPLIQHVFDYLLCRPPIAAIYLSAAVVLAHGESIRKLVQEDEAGMLHAVLATFPSVNDGVQSDDVASSLPFNAPSRAEPSSQPEIETETETDTSVASDICSLADTEATIDTSVTSQGTEPASSLREKKTLSPPGSIHTLVGETDKLIQTDTPSRAASHPISRSLSDLLRQADDLYTRFPPTEPLLLVNRIFGPQSVLLTWTERAGSAPDTIEGPDATSLITDDEAESMVNTPALIVRPDFVDEDEEEPHPKPARRRRKPAARPGVTSWEWWASSRGEHVPSPVTVLAGVVMVVSIGIAVYDIQRRGRRDA